MVWLRLIKSRILPSLQIGLILLFLPSVARSELGFQADATLVSRYIWRGFDTIADDRPAIQPSVTLAFGQSGVWLNLWSAVALADTHFVELDLIAGYDRVLSGEITFSAGLGYFTFPSMPHYPDKNSTSPEVYAGITASSLPLTPALTLYYDFNVGDGLYATLSLSRDVPVKSKTIHLSVLAGYTRQYQDFGVDPGFSDICLGLSTDFGVKDMRLTPSFNYVIVPSETINDEDEFWAGLMISWSPNRSTD
jgi:uncharacterized protein (TIGR02001 family)